MVLLPVALGVAAFGLVVFVIGSCWSGKRLRDERIGAAALMLGCMMAFIAQLVH